MQSLFHQLFARRANFLRRRDHRGNRRGLWIPALLQDKSHVHQTDHDRHLHQRTDYRYKGRAAVDAEDRRRHCNCQLEVVAGGRECECCRFGIIRADGFSHPKRNQEHRHEVNDKRNSDTQRVKRDAHDKISFEGEQHHNCEEQGDQCHRADTPQKDFAIPVIALDTAQVLARISFITIPQE